MKTLKVFKVYAYYESENCVVEFATCTTLEYAEKAIERLVNENYENRNELYIKEENIILDAIYNWHDGDLTVQQEDKIGLDGKTF